MRYINVILVCGLLLVASGAGAQYNEYDQRQDQRFLMERQIGRQQMQGDQARDPYGRLLQEPQPPTIREHQLYGVEQRSFCENNPGSCAQGADPYGLFAPIPKY